jgi:hypothetical protein
MSGHERLVADMTRQMDENRALKSVRAEGIPCPGCGARIAVPDDGPVQVVCPFCRTPALLADFAPPDAVARARLKHKMAEFGAAMDARATESERTGDKANRVATVIALVVVALVAIAGIAHCVSGGGQGD